MSTTALSPAMASVRRRYIALTALRWLPTGLGVSTMVLLMSERGLGVAAIGALVAAYSITTLALEIPSGALADLVGRRPVLLASAVLTVTASVAMALGQTLWWLGAAYVLMGVSRALDTGPLQAWFVDSSLDLDPQADLRTGLSRGGVAESTALAVGALTGGALVALSPLPTTGAPLIALSTPFLVASVLSMAHLGFVVAWIRDPRRDARVSARGLVADLPRTVGAGLALARRTSTVRRLLIATAAVGAALAGLELLGPLRSAELLGGESAAAAPFAALVTAGFLGSAAGAALAPGAARLARSAPRAAAIAMLGGAGALAAAAIPVVGAFAVAFVAFYLLLGIMGPLSEELLHRSVGRAQRATVLSLSSMALQSTGAVVGVAAGPLAAIAGLGPAFGVIAAMLALGSLALVRWPQGTDASSPSALDKDARATT